MTKKQKKQLRLIAHDLKPVLQIGKDGLIDQQITAIRNYLNKHEIMKISILSNCINNMDEIVDDLIQCGFDIVQVIGKTIIIYKESRILPLEKRITLI